MTASARARAAGAVAGLVWVLLGLRWFDAAAPWRPAWLERVPPALLAFTGLLLGGLWLAGRWPGRARPPRAGPRGGLLLVVGLAVLFRLPLAGQGAAGYVTPDGALSGIVALHVRDGTDHLVFVPHVPYSGSLKSHLTAPLAAESTLRAPSPSSRWASTRPSSLPSTAWRCWREGRAGRRSRPASTRRSRPPSSPATA